VADEKKKGDLLPRLITAAIGVPILLWLAILCPNWSIWLLYAIASSIAMQEWGSMCLGKLGIAGWIAVTGPFALLSAAYWGTPVSLYATAALIVMTVTVASVWTGAVEGAAKRITALLGGLVYTTVLFGGLLLLVADPAHPGVNAEYQGGWVLFPMFVIWSGDTGAYFAGRTFGKHKLSLRLSPKKTWEGAIGGTIASVGGGLLCMVLLLPHVEVWQVIVLALPAAILGQIGDLCESAMKRATGVKDSGRILYGHGGMLDRVDGLIFAAPYVAVVKLLLEL
jgi:phosphatidate cytidylyltransferase